jgi:hypothetical protein
MASDVYGEGDTVKVYGSASNAAADTGGVETTILRKMPDAEDYEVDQTEEQQQSGVSPFVTVDRLRLVKAAPKSKSKPAPAPESKPES